VSAGIVVGSYLDQLLDLKRRVELAIEAERRAPSRRPACRVSSETVPAPRQGSSPTSPADPHDDQVRVAVRDVRAEVIRDWATVNGYALNRGRIPHMVLDEFVEAHR
jgi:hypothetical protein